LSLIPFILIRKRDKKSGKVQNEITNIPGF